MPPTLDALRRYAIARSLFAPTTLGRAIETLGFVQADPIRAPARAQDLTLRHRVKGYVAGDLERRYPRLDVQEDFFVNYGFLPSTHWAAMHPRSATKPWDAATRRRATAILEFVQAHGSVHPRTVDAHFAHGSVTNYWGGASNATTHLLDALHYRGLLRVVRRDSGVRIYAAHAHPPRPRNAGARRGQLDTLVDLIVRQYAPLPATSLWNLVARLQHAVPQHRAELRPALLRAKARLAHARIDAVDWYWPAEETPPDVGARLPERVRLLAPFDPVVWDRRRFELFWGWPYRFEAYVPAPARRWGYYALPLLWRDRVIGWGNVAVDAKGRLQARLGHVERGPTRDPIYRRELDAELERMKTFLGLASG
ncbi:MAG: crosslink repair DNA glycosylase YcaQ family protein [Burkholderiaceae bacterium]